MKELLETSEAVVVVIEGMADHAETLAIMRETAKNAAEAVYNPAIIDNASEEVAQSAAQKVFDESLISQKKVWDDAEESRIESEKEKELNAMLDTIPANVRKNVLKVAEDVARKASKAGKTDKEKTELGDAAYLKSIRGQCEQIAKTMKEREKETKKAADVPKTKTVEEKKAEKAKAIRDEQVFFEKQNPAKLVLGAFGKIDDKDVKAAFEKLPGLFKGEREVEPKSYVKTKTGIIIVAHGTRSGMKKVTV